MFYNRKGFTSILETLRHSFWPANTVDPNTEKQIWTSSKTLIVLFLFLYVVPVASLAFFLILPILKGIRSLPYTYCLLSDRTRESPMFEMMYAFQTIAVIFLPVNVLAGHDYMYNAFCANCSAQFRLLHSAIRFVGSGNEDEMIQRLSELPGVEAPSPRKQDNKAKILLVICIKHHQNLLR